MAVVVVLPNGDDREPGSQAGEEGLVLLAAPVVRHLQDVHLQGADLLGQPFLRRRFGVSGEKHPNSANVDEEHQAGVVRCRTLLDAR